MDDTGITHWMAVLGARESYKGLGMTYLNRSSGNTTSARNTKEIHYGTGVDTTTSPVTEFRDMPVWSSYMRSKTKIEFKNKIFHISNSSTEHSLEVTNKDQIWETDLNIHVCRMNHEAYPEDTHKSNMKIYRIKNILIKICY